MFVLGEASRRVTIFINDFSIFTPFQAVNPASSDVGQKLDIMSIIF